MMFQLASVSLTHFGGNAFHLEKMPGGGGWVVEERSRHRKGARCLGQIYILERGSVCFLGPL